MQKSDKRILTYLFTKKITIAKWEDSRSLQGSNSNTNDLYSSNPKGEKSDIMNSWAKHGSSGNGMSTSSSAKTDSITRESPGIFQKEWNSIRVEKEAGSPQTTVSKGFVMLRNLLTFFKPENGKNNLKILAERRKKLSSPKEVISPNDDSSRFARTINNYLFAPRFHFSRFQFNLVVLVTFIAGSIFGLYFLATGVLLPKIFATAASSVTRTSDTDFSQGTLSSTTVSGSGATAVVQLSGAAGPDNTFYKRPITITNTGGGVS